MNRSDRSHNRPSPRRRGVTLVEMLVTVAILIIIMTVLVQVFQAATTAVSGAQAIAQLDDQLRRIDGTIRSDLEGVTARFTPPLDPLLNLGYFEYGENEFADLQGEDSDDYIRFTAMAPPGQLFTGRMWIPSSSVPTTGFYNADVQPVTITSQYAEIIYFLRNGNLYRRVLLIAPQLQSSIYSVVNNQIQGTNGSVYAFYPTVFGNDMNKGTQTIPVSWQGINDLSARPSATGNSGIVLNTLGDLTNRENRFAYPRFANDFFNLSTGNSGPDGLPDDLNGDNVPDLYRTFYPAVFNTNLIFAPNYTANTSAINLMAFPYIFPAAYSRAQTVTSPSQSGWIHSPDPVVSTNGNTLQFDTSALTYLQNINHNPLDQGDNLYVPPSALTAGLNQTWWGFPTWRETLSTYWNDPTVQVNVTGSQPNLLQPLGYFTADGNEIGNGVVDTKSRVLLPPMNSAWRVSPQLFNDGLGDTSNLFPSPALWTLSWEDDLIMTGVRSFDVKAYDNALAAYADLGWGDDVRTSGFTGLPFFAGNPDYSPGASANPSNPVYPPRVLIQGSYYDYINQTFAHEGRMPPRIEDNRLDAQFPNPSYVTSSIWSQQYQNITDPTTKVTFNFSTYSSNVGDDDSGNVGVARLRRVWDSWSTDYSRAPGNGIYNNNSNTADVLNGFPWGPPLTPPVYPSYPPPYPAPLRGIQIQIRVVDPTNQRIKTLTIVQDFTDKL